MTRTALPPTTSLPPCILAPELWDCSDNTKAIAACRQQCRRRFACAQEALTGPKHLVSTLNGVIAGIAIPAQNEHGTSKAHKSALQRLEAIAELGRTPGAATTNPCARLQLVATRVDKDEPLPASAAKPTQPSIEGQELDGTHQPPREQPDTTGVIVLPRGWRANVIPNGEVDIAGAARMTGLTVKTLRSYRQLGRGPKSWLTPRGFIRYWVSDVDAWMAQRQPRRTDPVARAS